MNHSEALAAARYEAALRQRAGAARPAIGYAALRGRIRRGWTPREAIEAPVPYRAAVNRDRDQRILAILSSASAPLPRAKVAMLAGVSLMQAWRSLDRLRHQGLVDRTVQAQRSRWWATRRQ